MCQGASAQEHKARERARDLPLGFNAQTLFLKLAISTRLLPT